MAEYQITIARSAAKEIEALPPTLVNRIFPKIESLAIEQRPKGCKKLRGENNLWRIRVGDYRVLYAVHEPQRIVDIIAVRHRKDAYQ